MTTVQIVGIAVATAVVVLLVIALVVSRRRGERHDHEEPAAAAPGSFLDEAPKDSLARLGKQVRPIEDVTYDPGVYRDVPPAPAEPQTPSKAAGPAATAFTEPTAIPAATAAGPSDTAQPDTGQPAAGQTMPLSDIIVTTSNKMVDLQDPEVRRMLTDLVKFEIDQATQFRQQGQTIDAVLQLTEAEKISRALGMHESAQHIHEMMTEMRSQT